MNSTVSNNHARHGVVAGAAVFGGGVLSYQRTGPHCPCADPVLVILDSTVTGNRAGASTAEYGGGVYVQSGTLSLKRSMVSGNQASTGREILVSGAVVSDEYNLFGHDGDAGVSGFVPSSTDIVPNESLEAILLPLADNGGGTRTHALAIGSPALDASPDDAGCAATDQRGNPRPRGSACDIGAFEGVAVLCNGKVTTMVGTIRDDRLTGTLGPDVISGLSGDDIISGRDGDDVICAGSGADLVYGGPRNDLLFGGSGDDRLIGQGGNDTLDGGAGQDECDGGGNSAVGDAALSCETSPNVP
jgi:Ca2+-binding RTX toxin-like protein